MRGRRNPQITMLAFIDLEERAPEWRSSADFDEHELAYRGADVVGRMVAWLSRQNLAGSDMESRTVPSGSKDRMRFGEIT